MEQFPPQRERTISVGILSAREVRFGFDSDFRCVATGQIFGAGNHTAACADGKILFDGAVVQSLQFEPVAEQKADCFEGNFCLFDVVIGIGFHWERRENQFFKGALKFLIDGDKLVAINVLRVEDYLYSVISSEMSATSSLELLKAHAVISRSWLLKPILDPEPSVPSPAVEPESDVQIRWYERDAHALFDVCADDHCQRYQGLSMAVGETVRQAIDETWGQVLTYEGEICDARFSKCCGGVMETFGTCWEDRDYPYLQAIPDTPGEQPGLDPFCHTDDDAILSQVLNDYDLETKDFYEWEVRYTREEVSELIKRRSGIDFGLIRDLVPLERGGSGRLYTLRVEGEKRTMTIGKELIIRRWLSESHLKSSAFDVHWEGDTVVLKGRGWGHGVGLCQIGAAVMSYRGYTYDQILFHYYPGSKIEVK